MNRIFASALVTSLLGGTAYAQVADPPDAPVPAESSALKISMFADAYYNFSNSKNDAPQPAHRAYSASNGFGLSFLGTDIVYDTEHFGATASLRFGPSVPIFYGRGADGKGLGPATDNLTLGLNNILQAYATWKPSSKVAIDVGQFGTIYGAEVAESWKNLNYTRGGLYYAMQPFWHTGVRAKVAVTDQLTLTGMVVNGVNNVVDSAKERPSIGVQAAYATEAIGAVVGYLGSTDPDADFFDHFVDLIVTSKVGKLNLVFNADYGMNDDSAWYGASLAGGLALTDKFGIAARSEYLADPDGIVWSAGTDLPPYSDVSVLTETVTLDFRPDPSGKLIIRLDGRFEKSSEKLFLDRSGVAKDIWFQSVLGVVVTTD